MGVKMRILIVDDDFISRRILVNSLVKYGEYTEAKNGQETIKLFRKAHSNNIPYDLVTLDLMMPSMSGPIVYSEIRKMEKTLHVPESEQVRILIVTTQNYLGSVMKKKLGGRLDYLVKPIDEENLIRKLTDLGFSVNYNGEELIPPTSWGRDELKNIFIQELGNRIEKLKRYIVTKDLEQIERLGHKLHGTGSTYGFQEVTVAGAKLEIAGKKGDWAEINSEVDTLTILYQKNHYLW